MNNLRFKITFFEQIKLLFKCNRDELEIRIKELDLQSTNAKNIDIKHLENVAINIMECDKNTKNPLTLLYITTYSALTVNKIIDLNLSIDMDNPKTINTAMEMANKGFSNRRIINTVLSGN